MWDWHAELARGFHRFPSALSRFFGVAVAGEHQLGRTPILRILTCSAVPLSWVTHSSEGLSTQRSTISAFPSSVENLHIPTFDFPVSSLLLCPSLPVAT